MLTNQHLTKLANHVRSKITAAYDPATMFSEDRDLREQLKTPHKGLYVGVVSSTNESLVREGFLKEEQKNVLDSAEMVISSLQSALNKNNVTIDKIKTATFHFSVVSDCVYMPDPTVWDENKDGIYFMWGQKYRGLYLPYQIKSMNLPKSEIMDRLCSWECGVVSNLWKFSEGLCWRIITQSHSA